MSGLHIKENSSPQVGEDEGEGDFRGNGMRMSAVLTIDGSYGEGGGQIVRTALALSAILDRPVELVNIRAGRKNPGLRPPHLAGVRAPARMTGAQAQGAELGSTALHFIPGRISG